MQVHKGMSISEKLQHSAKGGSVTVQTNALVPQDYKYVRRCTYHDSSILYYLKDIFPEQITHIYDTKDCVYCDLPTGFYNFASVDVWIHNQSKHGQMSLYFKSIDEYNKLIEAINAVRESRVKKIVNPVYRYSSQCGWCMVDTYSTKDAEKDIFGYDHYITTIAKDISNHTKYNDFLKSLGEMRSINYLLYGPPGTGKTSLIKAIASKIGCAVFIVNTTEVSVKSLRNVLTPNVSIQTPCKLKLLLFEDFDRFLKMEGIDGVMSQILNTLDGFDDRGDVVRFFTANNQEAIFAVDALINRMSGKFEFFFPDKNIFKSKLERFLSFYESYDSEKADKFLDMVCAKKITVRPFVNYIIRYLFDSNYLDAMIENINELN
jgi:hypothetical protein